MTHKLGLSGSVILTNPDQFMELFKGSTNHIEIGEFSTREAFDHFIELYNKNNITLGIHSPLYRNHSKYDLIEKVQFEPEHAWIQFEKEVEYVASLGASYILVHFPYFKEESIMNVNDIIEEGLKRLRYLQDKYEIMIVCEPKLGMNRSPAGIQYLHQFPLETWEKYEINICIDIGDYLLAVGEQTLEYIMKWKDYVKVVHLHNVEFHNDKYIWVPVHPSHEGDKLHFSVSEIIQVLATFKDVFFVFEHTPHSNPSEAMVLEGITWVKELITEGRLHKQNG